MKPIVFTTLFLVVAIVGLKAEPISVVRAAELATKFITDEKIQDKPMSGLFEITGLHRLSPPGATEPGVVLWRADLGQTPLARTSEEMKVLFLEEVIMYRRVLEIHNDGSVVMGKIPAQPRPRIVEPRPRVVPPPK